MRQVSPESPGIFDFIMDLYHACDGKWDTLVTDYSITPEELEGFLEYAAMFLCNLGNFYGEGDQKFVPNLTADALQRIAGISPTAQERLDEIIGPLLAVPPFNLGYPSKSAQSAYYLGSMAQEEIALVSEAMSKHSVGPENTRVQKLIKEGKPVYHVLQASAETGAPANGLYELANNMFLIRGDHSVELSMVCSNLARALKYASNHRQTRFLEAYIESFRTGSQEAYQESQKAWVMDVSARVENMIGFIESYRDPAGIRSEWEAMIGIADPDETARLKRFVERSTCFIRQLPWAVDGVNDGKGPFEKTLFEAPDFTSVHALAVCGSVVFEAANLPNYEYIRETCGFKNIVLANRLCVNHNPRLSMPWITPSELMHFQKSTHLVRFLTTAIHELIGHGTGILLSETAPGIYNFDEQSPPLSPLSGSPVASHYALGQTWTSVFGHLAGTVEECRAILVSEYLMDNKELLSIFGYTDASEVTVDDLLYTTYLNIGVDGLQALEHYSFESKSWGQVHHQAHFSIMKHLLQDGGGVIHISQDLDSSSLTVHVDRSKIASHGKPSLGRYLCRLHIWRCTADFAACRDFYEPLCAVEGLYEQWRQIVCSKPRPRWKFVQPNTFVDGDTVEVKVYEESNRGIIQSWAERDI
ncbi:hypothetical protein ASPZODRAFT_105021 [Penicilliopsis zonata CBS 506.65]|uniref:Dipeptidyl peptidase III n=1 Tax=Penicilliopsis zonata CBS 506.65 TaxID=1073090 RepID=A0A1L9S612_9EURO|nr:hypothetical protein ASPZODRAFT_105021 [Penicilliopsis zonata CBS 506.65]OJJ42596.1 hypothetical protein ASPZODRAFT_105021 [Penicilliopsis zonata CBS 506.65]